MNKSRNHSLRHTAAALLLCTGLASCSQDDLATGQGEPLTPGMYPLEITAGGLQAVAAPGKASVPGTRSTVDNDWIDAGPVAVEVGDVVKEYTATVSSDGKTATLTSSTPFYWESSDDEKTVTAWHPYSNPYPTDWKVKADQSSIENYEASDLIKGVANIEFTKKDDTPMTFYHQTAKVTVNLIAGDGVSLDGEKNPVQLLNVSGVEDGATTITPYRPDNTEHTYLALLNGQTIGAGTEFIQITANGNTYSYKPDVPKELATGTAYTFDITVKETELEVTVNESIGWGTGNSGEGSVTLPEEIDLSQVNGEITIGDGAYILKGNGKEIHNPIIVNGNADITFENKVKIKVDGDSNDGNTKGSVAMKIADDKTVKLSIKGTGHSLISTSTSGDYGCGIELGNGAAIEITGDGRDNSSLTVKAGARNSAIGPKSFTASQCIGITIKDIDLTVETGELMEVYTNYGAAIGLNSPYNNLQSMQFIRIENAKITATGRGSGTCIGIGSINLGDANIGIIEIANSALCLTVEKKMQTETSYLQGACIGFGAAVSGNSSYSHTIGSIEITNTTFDDACSGHHLIGYGFQNEWNFQSSTSITNGITIDGVTYKDWWNSNTDNGGLY